MNKQQRIVLMVSILASFVAFLDGSVVNVALPAIVKDLGGGLVTQQWVVDAYLITLGSFILVAGSFSDLFGRKRILLTGLIWFAVASILCALAPNATILICMRALQGISGALLVPSALAIIISNFSGSAQGKAIGSWTAWTGIAFVVGPLLGGFLVDTGSWRLIFAINILPILLTIILLRFVDKPDIVSHNTKIDAIGVILCTIGLGLPVFAFIEQPSYGWQPMIYLPLALGVLSLLSFIRYESVAKYPMLPLGLFKTRNFSVGNIATASIYAGLAIATFLITIFIQQVGRYSAIQAGAALLPITIIMFILSPLFGKLAGKYGPRYFMTLGPAIGALGFLMMLWVNGSVQYWSQLFPGILAFSLGLSITVAPLTTAILGLINRRSAGIASAINNAIARIAGLIAIAAISSIVGKNLDVGGFHRGLIAISSLLFIGAIISWIGIVNPNALNQSSKHIGNPELDS